MEASPGQRGTVSRFMLDNGMRGELDRPALLIGLNLKVLEALLGVLEASPGQRGTVCRSMLERDLEAQT
eukprot:scaffold281224_cov19-Tisochrysis_lutea.AAC.1